MVADDFDIRSDEFRKIITPDSRMEKIADGLKFTEGPAWFDDGSYLIFCDVMGNRLHRWSEKDGLSVFRDPSDNASGNTVDREGRLVTAGFGSRNVHRTEKDGSITVLAERYNGKKLNSPNDIVVKSDGTTWFSDPHYPPRESELPGSYVFRLDPNGTLMPVAEDMTRPNGIAFSPDERLLYVSDTLPTLAHIRVYEVTPQNTVKNGRVVVKMDPGVPDGFRLDSQGRIYTSAGHGIHVYAPAGQLLGKFRTPTRTANCEFGGPGRHTLYIMAAAAVYRITLASAGARRP